MLFSNFPADLILTAISSHNSSRIISHDSVEPDTLKRYSGVIMCLIAFVLRCNAGWESAYKMSLDVKQIDACRLIAEHLGTLPIKAFSRNNQKPLEDPDHYIQDGDDNEDDEDDDEEFFDDDSESIIPDLREASVAQNQTEQRILDLLIALYTQLPSKEDNSLYSPLLRFIILSSHQKTGGWLPPRRITEFFSILLFCGRQVMYTLMWNFVVAEGIRFAE